MLKKLIVGVVGGGFLGAALSVAFSFASPNAVAMIAPSDLARVLGGTCSNKGCSSIPCTWTGCPTVFCEDVSPGTKCAKAVRSANKWTDTTKSGFDVSITGNGDCGTIYTGDQVQGTCPESACSVAGSGCGGADNTCTETSCPL